MVSDGLLTVQRLKLPEYFQSLFQMIVGLGKIDAHHMVVDEVMVVKGQGEQSHLLVVYGL